MAAAALRTREHGRIETLMTDIAPTTQKSTYDESQRDLASMADSVASSTDDAWIRAGIREGWIGIRELMEMEASILDVRRRLARLDDERERLRGIAGCDRQGWDLARRMQALLERSRRIRTVPRRANQRSASRTPRRARASRPRPATRVDIDAGDPPPPSLGRRADAVVAISIGALRAIVRAEVESAIARSKTRPAKRPKSTEPWTPETALHAIGGRVRR
jgi:hypothetical protein